MEYEILYEDAFLMAVRKPAGLATESAKAFEPDLVSRLRDHLGSAPGVVHRLDQPVEGLLVFGKTKEMTALLSEQLREGSLGKEYRALVFGMPDPAAGELTGYLRKEPGGRAQVRAKAPGSPEWKTAKLTYETLRGFGEEAAEVRVTLQTGRFHQIRAQFAAAGHPLLGDRKYGTPESAELSRRLGIRNTALCAYRLRFRHPKTGEELTFEIEPFWEAEKI
ncbi:MAG: RluA family pseudouridine synthase [Lachnospiraceae bacterium]|nr:RluA family pseudouridine synthase [Lachnospiraceae bacterium]